MIGKALVCDDSSADLLNIKNIVEGVGYLVSVAKDGIEAIDKVKEIKPDIVFLDIIMPGMDGYETCRRLADDPETRNIPVIFVTSKNQKADRIWGQMQGGKGLITKPFKDDDIINHLQQYSATNV